MVMSVTLGFMLYTFIYIYIYVFLYIYIYNSSVINIEHYQTIPQNLVHYWLTKWARDIHKNYYIYIYIHIYIYHGNLSMVVFFGSCVSSTVNDINMWLARAWSTIDWHTAIWKSDLSYKIKRNFFQAIVVSVLLYGCSWTLTKQMEKNLGGNCTRMLRATLNKSWKQHPTKPQLYGHQPPISKITQIRRARYAGHCGRSKGELISDVLLRIPSHSRVGRLARTYLQQVCTDTGCSQEDLSNTMDNKNEWRGRVREISARGTTWYIYIYIYIGLTNPRQMPACGLSNHHVLFFTPMYKDQLKHYISTLSRKKQSQKVIKIFVKFF